MALYDLDWDTRVWMSKLLRRERRIAQDHLRGLVDGLRAELGLPDRDWWFEDMGFARIRANLKMVEELQARSEYL